MNSKIINLVGASGSGKTTIAKELEKLGYNIIHSYTTREPRHENEWGHTFITNWYPVRVSEELVGFENGEDVDSDEWKYIDIDDMIAYKGIYGDHYFATKEQYQGKGISIYVVCPDGSKQVHENVKDAEVVTIFLMVNRKERIGRMLGQGRSTIETHQRLKKDEEIFKVCRRDYTVDANRELEEVLKDIIKIIN